MIKVGVAGFEPTTSSSRTTRATKLRYTPKKLTAREGFGIPIIQLHNKFMVFP